MINTFIHIGLHKTATKFLQSKVFPNIRSHYYLPSSKYERELFDLFFNVDYTAFQNQIDEIREKLISHTGQSERMILSNELFSGNPFFRYNNRHFCLLKTKALFPSAKIIISIRAQKSMMNSMYREYIWQGGTKKPEAFFVSALPKNKSILSYESCFDPETLKYGAYLDEICNIFGRQNVLILPYEKMVKDFQGYLGDLESFLGGAIELSGITPVRYHQSISNGFLKVLRVANTLFYSALHPVGIFPYRYNFMRLFGKINRQSSQPFLPNIEVDFSADNDYIDKKYNLKLRSDYSEDYY